MTKRDIVVIGASAGGIGALMEILKSLPVDFKASVFITVHIPPGSPSSLPDILSRSGPLKAIHPKDGERIEQSKIYVAAPDHHLLVENNYVVVKKGPKENRFRPSIDALFRSAAYIYGSRVIGIVLSGFLDDGTSGLWSVKRRGGICIIQEPTEAEFPDMPLNVLEYVDVDYIAKASEIGPLLMKLIEKEVSNVPGISAEELKRMELEIKIASSGNAFEMGIINMGNYTELSCPECHGSLISLKEGKLIRFRCHTGHGFTSSALLSGITNDVEDNLWQAMRGMEETTLILEKISKHFGENGKPEIAVLFNSKADESRERGKIMHELTFHQENLSSDIRHNR